MWRCDNVGGLGEHVKNTCCRLLGIPFKFFLLYSSAYAEPTHVDPFWRSICHTTYFRPRMCLLGSRSYCCPFLGYNPPKTPILGAWIGIFKHNKICIASKLLRRLQPNLAQWQRPPNTVRGWSQHAYNKSKMADGRRLEKLKTGHISGSVQPIFAKFGMKMHIWPPNRTRSWNFQLLKIQDGGRPPSWSWNFQLLKI